MTTTRTVSRWSDLLPDLLPLFEEIGTALTETPATGDEGGAPSSACVMTRKRATEIASKIVALHFRICAALLQH